LNQPYLGFFLENKTEDEAKKSFFGESGETFVASPSYPQKSSGDIKIFVS